MEKKRFSLRLKLVVFTTLLAVVTYTTSALFIYVLYDYVQEFWPIPEALFTIITFLLGIIWTGILAFFAAQWITKPLIRLENIATKAANGQLQQHVEIPKSNDEIRSLTVAFDTMLVNLREMVQQIDDNFEQTDQSVQKLKEVASQTATQTNIIGETVQQIAAGAESSAGAIQQTAESVDHAVTITNQVEQEAKSSQQKAAAMISELSYSKQVIEKLINGIQSVATEQESALEDVNQLEKNAREVEKIISMVGDISEQTNLLALNASIEAARAGEHGKGFAVVADEVRKLADQSSQAVQGIADLITNMQQDVRKVVTKMTEQVKTVRYEVETGEVTSMAMENMATSSEEVATTIQAISDLVVKQRQEIEQTLTQSQEVAGVAQQTSAGTQQVSATIQEQTALTDNLAELANVLQEQAQALKTQIRRFQ